MKRRAATRPSPASIYKKLLRAFGLQGWWPVTLTKDREPRYRPGFWKPLTKRQKTEVAMGAILTQNTNWENVKKALRSLHEADVWSWERIASIPTARLERLIRSSGYFKQKAKKFKIFARYVLDKNVTGNVTPAKAGVQDLDSRFRGNDGLGLLRSLRAELLKVWGVGPETADSILLYAHGLPVFVVDAYTLRIGRRLGWFNAKTTYHAAQQFLVERLKVEQALYGEFHALFVALAKEHCRTRPVCSGCPLLADCPTGRRLTGLSAH